MPLTLRLPINDRAILSFDQSSLTLQIMQIIIYAVVSILLGFLVLKFKVLPLLGILGIVFLLSCIKIIPTTAQKFSDLFRQFRWWHFSWVLLFFSGLVFRIRETEETVDTPLDFWAIYRIALVSLVGFILLYRLVISRSNWFPSIFQGLPGLLLGYCLVSLTSTLWSVYPMWSFYKSTEYLVDIILIGAIIYSMRSAYDFQTLFNLTWALVGLRVVLVWFGIVIWPDQALNREIGLLGVQISGVLPATSSNGVGGLSAVLATVSFCRFFIRKEKNQFYLVVFLISICTLILSQTRSALVGFLCAVLVILFATRKIGLISLALGSCVGLVFLSSAGDIFLEFFMRGQGTGLFTTLSGRTVWWEIGWRLFTEEPLFGYGGYAGARFKALSEAGRTITSSIHNTWLEILLGVGIIGFSFFALCFVGIWITLFRIIKKEKEQTVLYLLAVEALGTMAVLSVRSVFASSLIWHPSLPFFLVLGYAEIFRRLWKKSNS